MSRLMSRHFADNIYKHIQTAKYLPYRNITVEEQHVQINRKLKRATPFIVITKFRNVIEYS